MHIHQNFKAVCLSTYKKILIPIQTVSVEIYKENKIQIQLFLKQQAKGIKLKK